MSYTLQVGLHAQVITANDISRTVKTNFLLNLNGNVCVFLVYYISNFWRALLQVSKLQASVSGPVPQIIMQIWFAQLNCWIQTLSISNRGCWQQMRMRINNFIECIQNRIMKNKNKRASRRNSFKFLYFQWLKMPCQLVKVKKILTQATYHCADAVLNQNRYFHCYFIQKRESLGICITIVQ